MCKLHFKVNVGVYKRKGGESIWGREKHEQRPESLEQAGPAK